jgi:hypothetical protein
MRHLEVVDKQNIAFIEAQVDFQLINNLLELF